jgi:dihydroorotase
VFVVACVSRGREGKELADIGQLVEAGAVAFSDDGAPVYDAELMRRALEDCRMFDKPVLAHEEVLELSRGGVMHEGLVSLVLGLTGMPAAAEEVMIGRDIALAEVTGGRLHVMHVSTAGGVALIREAKRRGARVTATDHAPHAREKKMLEIDRAPFGILGLETAVGLAVTRLILPGRIGWPRLIEAMSTLPARILGLSRGTLRPGAAADITLIDPDLSWRVDVKQGRSKSVNSPFDGWVLQGRAVATIVGGRVKYRLGA